MKNDLPPALSHPENERDAYNAAFYELGLRWHWDSETYAALLRESPEPEARIRRFMEMWHPHLLAAYDATFLAAAIHERVLRHKPCTQGRFDWAQAAACEVGA